MKHRYTAVVGQGRNLLAWRQPCFLFFGQMPKGGHMNDGRTLIHGVRFTPMELAALRSVADERSCSVGAVVRWAVRKAVLADPTDSRQNESKEAPKIHETGGASFAVQS